MIARCPKCGAEMEGDVAIGDFVECPSCNETFTLKQKDVVTQMDAPRQVDKGAAIDAMSGSTRKRSFRVPQFAQGALATALVFTVGILLFSHCPNKGGDADNQARANEGGNVPSATSEPPVKTASAPPASKKTPCKPRKPRLILVQHYTKRRCGITTATMCFKTTQGPSNFALKPPKRAAPRQTEN